MNQKELINYLDQVRRDKNLTHQELGNAIGKHRVQVGNFFKMKNAATLEMTIDIANALGIKIELVGEKYNLEETIPENTEKCVHSCYMITDTLFKRNEPCKLTKQQHKF